MVYRLNRSTLLLLIFLSFSVLGESVDFSECEVAGIALNDSASQVRGLVGNPNESGPECNGCIDLMNTWYQYDGLHVHFTGNQVFGVKVTDSEYRLKSGLGVASKKSEVMKHYGATPMLAGSGKEKLVYPVTFDNGRETQIKLVFTISDGVVTTYEITLHNVE